MSVNVDYTDLCCCCCWWDARATTYSSRHWQQCRIISWHASGLRSACWHERSLSVDTASTHRSVSLGRIRLDLIYIQFHSESKFGFTGRSNGLDSWTRSSVTSLLFGYVGDVGVTSTAKRFRFRWWIGTGFTNPDSYTEWTVSLNPTWIQIWTRQIQYGLILVILSNFTVILSLLIRV